MMSARKVWFSGLLLMIYSIGYAHELLPHCHIDHPVDHIAHEAGHHHHEHLPHDALAHDHIVHDQHLDHGLFDFVICLLNEWKHPLVDMPHLSMPAANANAGSVKTFVSLLCFSAIVDPVESKIDPHPDLVLQPAGPDLILSNCPHRGPPPSPANDCSPQFLTLT